MNYTIETATPRDASLIADAILAAIGPELTENLGGRRLSTNGVKALFARLAARDDSQYSYLNTRIARDESGSALGVCISYDGANLKQLRRPFFAEANENLRWNMTPEEIEAVPGETDSGEYYLDTLMTLPEYRGKGVGRALILDAAENAAKARKPLGLLCDVDNENARRLYESIGFRTIGMRPFAGHMMNHMQLAEQ